MLLDYPKAGVAVFALDESRGIAGNVWLAASGELRAGTLGRHSAVDLYLDDDDALSLRHLLLLVKARGDGVWLRIDDLATPGGFQAEEGKMLRSVEATGPLVLRAASYSFFAFPTGGPLAWNRDAWSTLPRREFVSEPGPVEPGPEPLVKSGEAIEGQLVMGNARLEVGAHALDRGVLLGRYARCSGDTGEMNQDVSRLHAMLARVDGTIHLIDLCSTNGTFKGDAPVKCAPVEPGARYHLGRTPLRWESPHAPRKDSRFWSVWSP